MAISRRSLLQAGGAGAVVLPLAAKASVWPRGMTTEYDGPGIYLYPAWGEPRPYLVVLAEEGRPLLEFRDVNGSALLWTQSPGFHAAFAGKVASL